MRIGIMQPYFFPYLGYFQLIESVDLMLLVDDFLFRKDFVNRNRILIQGALSWLTLPINKPSQNRTIAQHQVCLDAVMRKKLLGKLHHAYAKSRCNLEGMALFEELLPANEANLASALLEGVQACSKALKIGTPVQMVCSQEIAPETSGVDRILALCKHFGANEYVNLPGGRSLYCPQTFLRNKVRLGFVAPDLKPYPQTGCEHFVSRLSVLDLLMNVETGLRADFINPIGIEWAQA